MLRGNLILSLLSEFLTTCVEEKGVSEHFIIRVSCSSVV